MTPWSGRQKWRRDLSEADRFAAVLGEEGRVIVGAATKAARSSPEIEACAVSLKLGQQRPRIGLEGRRTWKENGSPAGPLSPSRRDSGAVVEEERERRRAVARRVTRGPFCAARASLPGVVGRR
jgi:hypothetical protein